MRRILTFIIVSMLIFPGQADALRPMGKAKRPDVEFRMSNEKGPLIMVLGRPGSGKTKLSRIMAAKLGLPFISIGELLRKELNRNPALKLSNEVAAKLIGEHVEERGLDLSKGMVLDTNPRRLFKRDPGGFKAFAEVLGLSLGAIININVTQKNAKLRIRSRGRALDFEPLRDRDRLPRWASKRVRTKVDLRMEIFRKFSLPVLEHFRAQDMVFTIDNNETASNLNHIADKNIPGLLDLLGKSPHSSVVGKSVLSYKQQG